MEIYFNIPFLDPYHFFMLLLGVIPSIVFYVLLFHSVWKYKRILKFSKLMYVSTLILLGFSLASFFIPSISATNVSAEEQITVGNIFTIYTIFSWLPVILLEGIVLMIFGWVNRKNYNYYIFIAGILNLSILIWDFLRSIAFNYFIIDFLESDNPMTIFFYQVAPYIFFTLQIMFYVLFLIHGLMNKQLAFRNTGIIIILVTISVLILTPYVFNFLINYYH